MANGKDASRADLDKMVEGVQPNAESVTKFLDDVSTRLESKSGTERKVEVDYLASKLEKEGKLPGLLIHSGMADKDSMNFRATTFNGGEIRKEDFKNLADKGKNGPSTYDAGSQLLATVISKKFEDIDKTGVKDDKVKPYEVKKWADDQTRQTASINEGGGVLVSSQKYNLPVKTFENVLTNFADPAQLRATFGTDTPTREQISKAVEVQQNERNIKFQTARELLGSDEAANKAIETFKQNGKLWSDSKMSAATYMGNPDNYNRIMNAKDESNWPGTNGDWVSADKLKEHGSKFFKTSLEQMAAKTASVSAASAEVDKLGAQLDARTKAAAPADATKLAEAGGDTKAAETIAALKKELDELKAKQAAEKAKPPAEAEKTDPPAEAEKTKLAEAEKTKLAEAEKTKLAEAEKTKLAEAEKTKLAEAEKAKLAAEKAKKPTPAELEAQSGKDLELLVNELLAPPKKK